MKAVQTTSVCLDKIGRSNSQRGATRSGVGYCIKLQNDTQGVGRDLWICSSLGFQVRDLSGRSDKQVKRVKHVADQVSFDNLMSIKNMFKLSLFTRRANLKRVLIKPNTSRSQIA